MFDDMPQDRREARVSNLILFRDILYTTNPYPRNPRMHAEGKYFG